MRKLVHHGTAGRKSLLCPQLEVAQMIMGKNKWPIVLCRHEWQQRNARLWRETRFGSERAFMPAERSQQESEELYNKALSDAAKIAGFSVSRGFDESRQKTWAEFEEFFGSIGHYVDAGSASDLDVIAFVQGHWISTHKANCRTRFRGDGDLTASASAVKGIMQHISKSYSMMGRQDEANPAKQESVKAYYDGYKAWLRENGVRQKRAKILKEEKVNILTSYLEKEIDRSGGLRRCVLRMDLAAVDYLWESWARGKECGELRAAEVNFEDGVSEPGWSKTVHKEPSAVIDMTSSGRERFLVSATALIREMDRAGHPVNMGYLFRPLNRSRDGFEDKALSANALRKRVQLHLKEAGLYEGETLHSFRRFAVQGATEIESYNVPKLMALGRWKSYSAFRLYIEEIESEFPR
jgi:integrase